MPQEPASVRRGTRFARQFGEPRGLVGRLVGRGMQRGNGELNRWVVQVAAERASRPVGRVVEIGPGPGEGLVALLEAFPEASVSGLDRSELMVRRARRVVGPAGGGRVAVEEGGVSDLPALGPVDLVVAVHVLYFWSDPAGELGTIRDSLTGTGLLALGYQVRDRMPGFAQRSFPGAGHRLYADDESVVSVVRAAGFTSTEVVVKHGPAGEEGRVVLARP